MASPSSVRSGSTRSMDWHSGWIADASPPVAITRGTCDVGHSAFSRATSPSMLAAAPNITPARMQRSVRFPIARAGATSSVAERRAARRKSVSAEVRMPGWMMPPWKTPSAVMQSYVVAVPRSTTMQSTPKRRLAASVL